jgi:hypothetical protein
MPWKDTLPPSDPRNVRITPSPAPGGYGTLEWDPPPPAADGDSGFFYAIYRVASAAPAPAEFLAPANIRAVVGTRAFPLAVSDAGARFAVRSLDRNSNESAPGAVAAGTGASLSRPASAPAGGLRVMGTVPGGLRISFTGALPVRVEALDLGGKAIASLRPGANEGILPLAPGFRGVCIVRALQADGRETAVQVPASVP